MIQTEASQAVATPTILFEGEDIVAATRFTVMADNTSIVTVTGLVKAFDLLLRIYYILNLVYPKDQQNTLLFMQKALHGIGGPLKNKPIKSMMAKMQLAL